MYNSPDVKLKAKMIFFPKVILFGIMTNIVYYRNIGTWHKFLCKKSSAFSVVKIDTVSAVQHSGQANGINIQPVRSFADDF